jgi:hypothetical protein
MIGGKRMKKAGFIAGAVVGALGIAGAIGALTDGRMRRRMYARGRRMAEKVSDVFER